MIDKPLRELYGAMLTPHQISDIYGLPHGLDAVITIEGTSEEEVLDMRKITLTLTIESLILIPNPTIKRKSYMLAPRDPEVDKVKYFGPHIGYVRVGR